VVLIVRTLFEKIIQRYTKFLQQKLTGPQLVKDFLAFYGSKKLSTAFTSAGHLTLSWARGNEDMHSIYWYTQCLLIYTVFIDIHSVYWYTQYLLIYTVFIDIHSVYWYTQCLLIYTVFIDIHSIYWYTQCLLIYTVFIHIHSVYWYTQCLLIYTVIINIHSVYWYAQYLLIYTVFIIHKFNVFILNKKVPNTSAR
jgi:hypothetical protein